MEIQQELQGFSAEERAVLAAAVESGEIAESVLVRLAKARRHTMQRAYSDKITDEMRRQLVGARVPKAKAEQYRRCAEEHGVSLYRFVCDALEREYWRLKGHDVGGIM